MVAGGRGGRVGVVVEDEAAGRERYEGLTSHDLRRANATGLVTANELVVAAARSSGATFLVPRRDGRAIDGGSGSEARPPGATTAL